MSVIICTYNGAGLVGETLDSVLAQTYPDLEVVVVDDGSTDNTWAVLQSYGERIRAIRQPNGGVAAARNAGLDAARGEFIALMDHDDLCEPERIAAEVAVLQSRPDVVLCCAEFGAFDARGPISPAYSSSYYGQCSEARGGARGRYPHATSIDIAPALPVRPAGPLQVPVYFGRVYEQIAMGNFVHPPTVLFRRSVLPEVGRFEPEARLMCDWDWLVRVARVGDFAFIDRPLLQYRRSASQISSERHHPRASVDALHVAERICKRDPSLLVQHRASFSHHLGEMSLDAAYANAEQHPGLALRLLARSMMRGVFTDESVRTLIKALLPNGVLEAIRRRRVLA